MEVEVKLSVPDEYPGGPAQLFGHLARLDRLGPYHLGPPARQSIRDVYFDTTDRRLGRARCGLRLRVKDGRTLITLKWTRSETGGLFTREEQETELTSGALQQGMARLQRMGLLPAAPYRYADFACGRATGALVPVLAAVSDRLEHPARAAGRPSRAAAAPNAAAPDPTAERLVAHLTLDVVRYEVPGTKPYHDIEIELTKRGRLEDLQALQGLLQAEAGGRLQPSTQSKLGRGLRLSGEG